MLLHMNRFDISCILHPAGPRMCIGYKFALQELHLALARLYQRFTFRLAHPDEPLRLRYGITISPIGGLPVIARHR